MSTPELSIIIVNYNGGRLAEDCVASLYANPAACSSEIVFIDNASTDGSGEAVAARFDQVRYIRSPGNVGLAKAFNQGIQAARGEFLLSLDSDTRVLPGALTALVEHLRDNAHVGAVGSRLFDPDMTPQKTARRTPSALNAVFGRRSLVTRLFPNNPLSRRYLMDDFIDRVEPFDVGWLSTASLMVRRAVVEQVGGLDLEFFVYWVDADWCARIRKAGWAVQVVPASRVIHDENLKGKRRSRRSVRMIADFHRGAFRYYRRQHIRSAWSPMLLVAAGGLTARAFCLVAWDYLRTLEPPFRRHG